jgi:FkbM family methyltransferase
MLMLNARFSRVNWFGIKPIVAPFLALPLAHAVARPVLPKSMLWRLPVRRKSVDYVAGGLRVTLLNPIRDQVAKDLYWGNGAPTSRADRRVLRYIEHKAREADIFLDIGSYSGLFALIAARANPKIRSVAYDILPENQEAITENARHNGLSVEAKLCGLSDRSDKIVMPRHYGTYTHPSSISLAFNFENGVEVPITTWDSEDYSGRILAKIDVEGFEAQVIAGGRETITACKPDIICELLHDSQGHAEIEAFLRPLGYRFFLSRDSGFEERERLVPSTEAKDWLLSTNPPGVD